MNNSPRTSLQQTELFYFAHHELLPGQDEEGKMPLSGMNSAQHKVANHFTKV